MNTDSILDAANIIAANATSLFETSTINGEFPDTADLVQYTDEQFLVINLLILRYQMRIASQKISAAAEHLDVLSSAKLTPSKISEDRRRTAKQATKDLYDIARCLSGCDQ